MLTGKKVRDGGLLPMAVTVPFGLRHLTNRRLFSDQFLFGRKRAQGMPIKVDVEIFMQAVDYEIEKFFCILLPVLAPFLFEPRTEVSH